MRAATVIVGAVAVSSVLIALAFILSSNDSSGEGAKVKTVTERREARAPQAEGEEPTSPEAGAAAAGGLTPCHGGELSVENVSCEVGEEIHLQYEEGNRGELIAEDREANETITMSCEVSTPVICTGPVGAAVYFEP
ncbi:MAG TPA: hypothetical protein VMT37_15490 [Solirubrobacterales bacterium]|nr:hypothetical protein [Solirubrobacterales bacterium]